MRLLADYPKYADQSHDSDPRGVQHEREKAEDDHEHVNDVPPAVALVGARPQRAQDGRHDLTRS